ncbi:MAG: cation:proton antiporter [Ardenticatenales bacterium]|nr:cation:proton antiporter [Ardenticatenales bacterium]
MNVFTPVDHHDILLLLIQVTVLLGVARLLGEVALRLGQSSVIGEILAGIILGPSLLSTFVPFVGQWIMPHSPAQGHLLEVISLLGAMLLLLITGLETDLALIRQHARSAIGASVGGILFTFTSGCALGLLLPDFLLADPSHRTVFTLFIATSMVISSIPIIAKVLMDLGLMRRDISQTILAAGMSDDTAGWILLSVVAGLATGGSENVGGVLRALGSVALFLALSFTLGRWLVRRTLDYVQDEMVSPERLLTLVMVLTLGWGAISQGLGLEAVLGAFVMGILLAQMPHLPTSVRHTLESITMGIFAPIFFAVAGLKVNMLMLFSNPTLLGIALLFLVVATVSKVAGTYLGARLIGRRDHWAGLSFGAGLNARGAMGIIVASIGLDLGILTGEMFAIILLMAIVTSLAAPVALRLVLQRVSPGALEQSRLQREALARGSLLANVRRVLLPLRGEQNIAEAAHIIQKLAQEQRLSMTLLHITDEGGRPAGAALLERLAPLFGSRIELLKKVVVHSNFAQAILEEANKNYDLLMLGASEGNNSSQVVFTPMVDYLLRAAPCATLVVKGTLAQEHWPPRCILVPTNGGVAARHAAELGFTLVTQGEEHKVTILNVVRELSVTIGETMDHSERRLGMAHLAVEHLREMGVAHGVRTDADVRVGPEVAAGVLEVAAQKGADLIILGTDLRVGSDKLYLGPRVEAILNGATCPVIVVNNP